MRGGVLVVLGVLASAAHAEPAALDKPAFTATPAELLALAKNRPAGTIDAFVLRQENDISFDDRGRITSHWRSILVVTSQAGVNDWNTLGTSYLPAYQAKPTVRARVIDPSGSVTELDPTRITETPTSTSTTLPDARRRIEAQLPRLQVGSVVEEEVDSTDREPLLGGGALDTFVFTHSVPVVSARLVISAPAKRNVHLLAKGLSVKPKTETRAGRQRITFVAGPFAPEDEDERNLPPDAIVGSFVSASVAESWETVARDYRALVDRKISDGPVPYPAEVSKTGSLDTVSALVAWLHRNVRNDELDFGDATFVPSTPAETLKRGTGDAKDKAVLLVSLLRQAGITADLALIHAGYGVDVDRQMVALDAFDDVLVRATVAGKELWIDPTSMASGLGQLPAVDQARLALVIADKTKALVSTPIPSAADNTAREVRTYELAELGACKVTEVSRATGSLEVSDRAWYRDTSADTIKKSLTDYARDRYQEATLERYATTDATDVSKPFEITVVAKGSKRGFSERMHADVYLFRSDLFGRLPEELTSSDDKTRVRRNDFVFSFPHTSEIENRIVIPAGFAMPTPAPEKVRELGTMKLVEQQRVDGQTFVVTFRLETGKRRISPADVTRIQEALRALRKESAVHIVLESSAKSLAARGKYPEALAEGRRVIAQHPKEALHHSQLATVLLEMGAGEAARREAKKATEVEPTSADAFVVLGWTLTFDTFGHRRGFDHDRAGAIAAFEKARKLDPKHVGAALELARLVERSPDGRLYDTGSDVKRAIELYRAVRAIDDDTETSMSLIRALLWAGEASEAESIARKLEEGETRNQLLVAAVAMGAGGPAAAIRTADTLATGTDRNKLLVRAVYTLLQDRQYDALRGIAAELGSTQNPQYLAVLKTLQRMAGSKSAPGAEGVVVEMLLGIARTPPLSTTSPLFADKRAAEEIIDSSAKVLGKVPMMGSENTLMLEDIIRSTVKTTVETEGSVARVEIDELGTKSYVYLVVQKGSAKVIGTADAPQGVGRYLLALLAKNDEKTPARVLDWVAAAPASIHSKLLAALWGPNLPRTKQAMELAAAVLTGVSDIARTTPIFKRCGATTLEGQFVCDVMLADAYDKSQNWSELDDHAKAWAGRHTKSSAPLRMRVHALVHLGKFDEADQLLTDALTATPDDKHLIHSQIEVAYGRKSYALAAQRSDPLTKRADATGADLNEAAWAMYVEGRDLANAHLIALRALTLDRDDRNLLNTIAAIEADTNSLDSAHDNLDRSMTGESTPNGGDWFVHGRILEQLGLTDDAIAAYRKVSHRQTTSVVTESDELAARRLKLLGVKK